MGNLLLHTSSIDMHKPTVLVELRRFIGRGAGVRRLRAIVLFFGNPLLAEITESGSCGVVQKLTELGF